MKKYLIALALLLTLGSTLPTMAQKNKKNQPTELVDSTSKDDLEAFSDTTDTDDDSTVVSRAHRIGGFTNNGFSVHDIMDSMDTNALGGMFVALMIVFIVFVISPLVIFGLLIYFVVKNRNQKIKLAQMAMQNGQPIPDQLLKEKPETDKDTYQAGMRQLFLGVGLAVFLGYTAGEIGFGIGALVFFIGLGKVVIAKTNKRNDDLNAMNDVNGMNNSTNPTNVNKL
jgi:hypothetical protein